MYVLWLKYKLNSVYFVYICFLNNLLRLSLKTKQRMVIVFIKLGFPTERQKNRLPHQYLNPFLMLCLLVRRQKNCPSGSTQKYKLTMFPAFHVLSIILFCLPQMYPLRGILLTTKKENSLTNCSPPVSFMRRGILVTDGLIITLNIILQGSNDRPLSKLFLQTYCYSSSTYPTARSL